MKNHLKLALVALFGLGLGLILNQFQAVDAWVLTATVLGPLVTGAGVPTVFPGQSNCEQFVLIGDVDTANPLQGLSIEIDGTPFINFNNSVPLCSAFMQWQNQMTGAAVGFLLKLSTGQIRANTTYTFINGGVTTPNVEVFSDQKEGFPVIATTVQVNINSYADFNKFSALFLTLPANVSSVEAVWADGHKTTMTIAAIDAYFVTKNNAEANGRLTAVSVIDNRDRAFKSIRVYAGATAVSVLIAKLPDPVFQRIKAAQ